MLAIPTIIAESGPAAGAVAAYVAAHVTFAVVVRRLAMVIPCSCRLCEPLRWLLLPIPVIGAVAGLAYGLAYAIGRLLMLVPGMLVLGLVLQIAGGIGFLVQLGRVAEALHTREVVIRA
ncbi:MAG: hypothetical protein MUF21_04135 [Gemmatimonadaceae bacterium]|nr:hypothetical protein [Gemmatimonadaceae bacterium]